LFVENVLELTDGVGQFTDEIVAADEIVIEEFHVVFLILEVVDREHVAPEGGLL